MIIKRKAVAGTLESSDVLVEISPGCTQVELEVESVVADQFGHQIELAVRETLEQFGVKQAGVRIRDRGALDCVLRARVETAIRRGSETQ